MIRAQAGNHFLFGITKENVTRLMRGEPISIKLNEHGLQGPSISIVLCYGETEESLALELQEFIGPTTQVKDHRSAPQPRREKEPTMADDIHVYSPADAFASHRPSAEVQAIMTEMRVAFQSLAGRLDTQVPACREKALAWTALEEAAMWAMKALALTDAGGVVVNPPPQEVQR